MRLPATVRPTDGPGACAPWTADQVVTAHLAGDTIAWRSCPDRVLEEVAVWAERHSDVLLRKVRAASRRLDARKVRNAQGFR